jgi:hypothetical protein
MTVQIPLSQIDGDPDAFAARVAAFRQAKLDHHKTAGEPAPREHELVEACVVRVPFGRREFIDQPLPPVGAPADDYEIVDYEIIDDRPSLRSRKDALIHQVSAQESALMEASLPPGKRRLAAMQAHDVLQKPPAERSAAETQFLADHDARIKHEDAIGRHAARLMSDIEDLTEATIDAWQPAPFPDQESGISHQGSGRS